GDDEFVMLGVEMLCGYSRVVKLVKAGLGESYRERLDRPVHLASHHRHNRARIDSARKKRAERHIAYQAKTHGFGEQLADAFGVIAFRPRGFARPVLVILEVPVAASCESSVLERQRMPRRQLVDSLQRACGIGHISKRKEVGNRFEIHFAIHLGMLKNRFDLRSKNNSVAGNAIMKRLHADAIARHEQLSLAFVPDRESKHSSKPFDASLTFVFVE